MSDELEDRLSWGSGNLEILPPDPDNDDPEDATEEEEKAAEGAETVTVVVPE